MSDVVGLGIDLVDVERFARVLARRPRLAARLFTDRERDETQGRPERLAARFAAKEATMKALGVGLGAVNFTDVEVCRASSGAPSLRVVGRAAELAATSGVQRWQVSLTHTDLGAAAVVLGLGS